MPDPEVPERPRRRRLAAAYKLAIPEEVGTATGQGQVGATLRRERLCPSHLVGWRRARDRGALAALARPPGRPRPDPRSREVGRLRRGNARLAARLATAERAIGIQGEASELLGIPLAPASDDEPGGS